MKIYLAGPCDTENRTMMMNIARTLRAKGHEVHCPFELKIPNAWDMSQEAWAKAVFQSDLIAINNCDAMVSVSVGRQSTAGTNWEQGFAYGLGIPCHVVQITDKPTSLMTYWGCESFKNATPETAADAILGMLQSPGTRLECETVLT